MAGGSRLTRGDIEFYLSELGRRMESRGFQGDILVAGGAAMSLTYGLRTATQDIDALFEPSLAISEIADEMAGEYDQLDRDWLNDGVKGFMSHTTVQVPYATYHALRVYVVAPEYMLSMKLMAVRPDSKDKNDIRSLVEVLGYGTPEEALEKLERHFPTQSHHVKAQYVLAEIMGA